MEKKWKKWIVATSNWEDDDGARKPFFTRPNHFFHVRPPLVKKNNVQTALSDNERKILCVLKHPSPDDGFWSLPLCTRYNINSKSRLYLGWYELWPKTQKKRRERTHNFIFSLFFWKGFLIIHILVHLCRPCLRRVPSKKSRHTTNFPTHPRAIIFTF